MSDALIATVIALTMLPAAVFAQEIEPDRAPAPAAALVSSDVPNVAAPVEVRQLPPMTGIANTRSEELDLTDAVGGSASTLPTLMSRARAAASLDVAAAQPQAAGPPPTPAHTGLHALFYNLVQDITKLPAMPNVYIAAVGGAGALAVHPADDTFNQRLSGHWDSFFAPGKYLGNTPEQVGASIVAYAYGRITHEPKVAHLAMDLLQAQIMSELLVEPLKYATQRLRPYQTSHCRFNCSFPSGHATITFADATVVERHLGWRYSIVGYAIASYVAASRLHDNRHWLSDVVFGAATGTIAGRTVVHHARDYWAFAPAPAPGGGVALVVTRTHTSN